jgi:hypothetical protein
METIMPKNKSIDLNNHLFAQLERLSDEEINGEELENEIKRAKAITDVSKQIISNNALVLKAHLAAKEGEIYGELPEVFETKKAIDSKNTNEV